MYAGVDIGGTKTLLAAITDDGDISEKIRFETPKNYEFFLHELRFALAKLTHKDFHAAGIGAPGVLDRKHGRGVSFGNLPWKNVSLLHDIERILGCPAVLDNDAKMAALSEALLLKKKYSRVLYVTVSTGIGYGLVIDGKLDDNIGDSGGRSMLVEHQGKLVPWESFASGHAIVERYGKRAEDIHDVATWKKIVRDLKPGLMELIAVTEPEVIVIGGSVGTYFDRYAKILKDEMRQTHIPLIPLPDYKSAQRPEEAVLFGCYDLAQQTFKDSVTNATNGETHAHAR
jgi:predicted NBD/HSP70 family sugar kinase